MCVFEALRSSNAALTALLMRFRSGTDISRTGIAVSSTG